MPAVGFTGGDPNKVDVAGDTMTGDLILDDASPAASEAYVSSHASGFPSVPLFNIEDRQFGARGDSLAFDGPAIRDAILAASEAGGAVLFPTRGATYRASASDLLKAWTDGQYAMFPLPKVAANSTTSMMPIALLGPTGATAVQGRLFANGNNVLQSHGAPVIQIEYDTPFTWSTAHGLPSVFGAPDADFGGGLSALFVLIDGIIIRQPDNPSMTCVNLENASACDIRSLYCDTTAFPDATSEPTHPTGGTLLLPKTGNAAWVEVGQVGAWGYYAGPAVSEHSRTTSQFVIACKIAAPMRDRGFAHSSYMQSLTAEECPYGVAGWDPSGTGPNLGVVAAPGGILRIERADFEDYDRGGDAAWMYTPTVGAHVYDPNNALHGSMRYMRVDSGSGGGAFDTAVVSGGSNFAVYDFADNSATTVSGHAPSNPVVDPPDAPTIGTATAGNASATVAFTAAATGATATSFTATSTPGSITGTGTSSPITVTGLTNGTAYTFTVHATNSAGNSAESAASNSVTPAASGGGTIYAADTFTRADSDTTLGTSSGGQVWSALNGTWGIKSNAGYCAVDNSGAAGGYNIAVLDVGESLVTYAVDVTPQSGAIDLGLVALVRNVDDLVFWDLSGNTLNSPDAITTRLFLRSGGSFTGITDAATVTLNGGTTYQLKMVVGATSIECFLDDTLVFASTGATGLESETQFGLITAAGSTDRVSTFDNLAVTSS